MEEIVQKYGGDVSGWKAGFPSSKVQPNAPLTPRTAETKPAGRTQRHPESHSTSEGSAPKQLHPKERESLLKLVIGMALAGYKYDPRAARSDTMADIESDLDELGIHLDADTIRKYLRQGTELLPQNKTEQKSR